MRIIASILLFISMGLSQDLPIRAAWWDLVDDFHPSPIPNDLLMRAKSANYNYIIVNIPLPNPRIGHHLRTNSAWRDKIKQLFIQVNGSGLRLIPLIQMSGKWDAGWTDLTDDYPDIQLNIQGSYTTAFAQDLPGTRGVDLAFSHIIMDIREGFEAAHLPYNLEYIHIGHDEPVNGDYLLVGNMNNTGTWRNSGGGIYGPTSNLDVSFLDNHGGRNNPSAYQALFADEINRRIKAVRAAFAGSPSSPRVMIEADMWDPQANGGLRKTASSGLSVIQLVDPAFPAGYAQGIASLPGISPADQATIRSDLILMPWNYYYSWKWNSDPDNNGRYDANSTYSYFASNGFSFVIWGANDPSADGSPASIAEGKHSIQQCHLFAKAYKGSNYLGYVAGYWPMGSAPGYVAPVWNNVTNRYDNPFWDDTKGAYQQSVPFETLEYMHNIRIIPSIISTFLLIH